MQTFSLYQSNVNQIRPIRLLDSTSSVGAGKTGLTYADVTCKYWTDTGHQGTVTLVDATLGEYQSGGFKEINSTDHPGVYEFHIIDVYSSALIDIVSDCIVFTFSAAGTVTTSIVVEIKDTNDVVDLSPWTLSNIADEMKTMMVGDRTFEQWCKVLLALAGGTKMIQDANQAYIDFYNEAGDEVKVRRTSSTSGTITTITPDIEDNN